MWLGLLVGLSGRAGGIQHITGVVTDARTHRGPRDMREDELAPGSAPPGLRNDHIGSRAGSMVIDAHTPDAREDMRDLDSSQLAGSAPAGLGVEDISRHAVEAGSSAPADGSVGRADRPSSGLDGPGMPPLGQDADGGPLWDRMLTAAVEFKTFVSAAAAAPHVSKEAGTKSLITGCVCFGLSIVTAGIVAHRYGRKSPLVGPILFVGVLISFIFISVGIAGILTRGK